MNENYTMHSLQGGVTVVTDFDTPEKPTARNITAPSASTHAARIDFPETMELAQAYVRPQPLEGMFSPAEGLKHGTIFPNLSKPYEGRISCKPC